MPKSPKTPPRRDYFQIVAKSLANHRFTFIGAVLALYFYCVAFVPGCAITSKDPTTGKPATAAEIVTNTNAKITELESKLTDTKATYAGRVEEIQSRAAIDLREAARVFAKSNDDAKREAETVKEAAQDSLDDIEKKQTVVRSVIGAIQSLVPGFTATPGGSALFNIGTTLLAGGAIGDSMRKNRVIKDLKGGSGARS